MTNNNTTAKPFDKLTAVYTVTPDYLATCEALAHIRAGLCDDAHVSAQLDELDKLYRLGVTEAEIAVGENAVAKAWRGWQAAQ